MKKTVVVLVAIVFTLLAFLTKNALPSLALKLNRPSLPTSVGTRTVYELHDSLTVTYYLPIVFSNYSIPEWQPSGLQGFNVRAIDLSSNEPGTIYAGTEEYGVYKTTNSGTNWQPINSGIRISPTVYLISIDPNQTQNLYLSIPNYPRLYFTNNGGQSWSARDQVPLVPSALQIHPAVSNRLFLGVGVWDTWGGGGQIYRSDNGGLNWTAVLTTQVAARTIAIAPQNPALIYAGGINLYRSLDGGDNWARLTNGLPDSFMVGEIALHPSDVLLAYISTSMGMFKTSDGGDTWSPWGSGLPAGNIWKIRISHDDPQIQFAASSCSGVYTSLDEGQHWQSMNANLADLCVNDLALDTVSSRLYAATQMGIWVIDLRDGN